MCLIRDTRFCQSWVGVISLLYGSALTSGTETLCSHHISIHFRVLSCISVYMFLKVLKCSWFCRSGRHVAVKVLKSGAGFTQAGQDELTLLRCVSVSRSFSLWLSVSLSLCACTPLPSLQASGPTARNPLKRHIVQLLDEFKIAGVNGIRILS